ncbi:magnesium transporter [Alteromonas pelagimontana]|uniref:Magnesium transporter n=1 Tax=Alteromonas pelagimontana TaxID=1858656 RepID=A0A6M4MDV0_9ALTE|nr:magnesium transporter [Alteromonas pelagimontana]QJR81197.1 magnesium transporter [Alteromonas pelagimontana]
MAEPLPDLIEELVSDTSSDDPAAILTTLAGQDDVYIATLLESLPVERRLAIWEGIPRDRKLDVLVEMRSDPREILIDRTPHNEWAAIFSDIEAEDLLELLDSLPNRLVDVAYAELDAQQQVFFREATQFGDAEVGHWVSHELLVLPLNAKVREGLRLIRRNVPSHCDTIFLVNRSGQFSAAVRLTRVFGAPEHLPLVELTEENIPTLKGRDETTSSSLQVQRSGYASLPVVDDSNKLLGRLDITSASELINEFYERQVMASAGMDEDEDLFSPVAKSAKNRALWLGINLLTAFLASWFIGRFEATLQQVVALAVLMPVVASMGGIAGSQTLTLIVRGLALGQVTSANFRALMIKELKVGGVNGVIWALVIGIVAYFWFSDVVLGMVICLAILFNIVAAAVAGVFLPVILDKMKIDPALSGSVILTTVTDIVGFVAFLGLGTLFLL